MRSPRCVILVAASVLCFAVPVISCFAQDPPPPPQATQADSSSSSKSPKSQGYSHANDFLITGTVFDSKGYAFPGVQLKIRRSTEKKFRWTDYTNSRGDFAVRVPQGTDYQIVMRIKGFADQTRDVDAKSGLGETRLVFRMEPGGGKKE